MPATVTVSKQEHFSMFGTNVSGQIDGAPFRKLFDEIESTVSGNLAHTTVPGLANHEMTVSIFMTQAIEDVLVANEGATGAMVYRRSTDAKGPANPEYTWTGWVMEIPYGVGNVGEPWKAELTIKFATTVTRDAA